jgi:hypothetical protein
MVEATNDFTPEELRAVEVMLDRYVRPGGKIKLLDKICRRKRGCGESGNR